mmetsp:Transcript_23255/g.38546  ORF Transcript_23255/g.38546 Transcript_23255/m.38546 type:complete len:545 (+) Transcript_23255:331-1965(+)|eukprot:CAMPEP_0119016490 /NCGR_PEP_ID=MMETSP1176-20130426/13266_1 /TAXON_ID=265551 /ORGANISM="Synedropsis recta cf, Strain CCMP1620" /LENGTH=544 /DNA_ID=CAMNT_0006969931 /DNA_START=309 /DNA_END=1943 /DNA_ORIENTATION=+
MGEYIYDSPTASPKESAHWRELDHKEGDKVIENLQELTTAFALSVSLNVDGNVDGNNCAFWSCLLGYCEALCTNKDEGQRYAIYPIPFDALNRLVAAEFIPPTCDIVGPASNSNPHHRRTTQVISNWVWGKVTPKSNVKDEKHANSLYVVLRGNIDGKSVDCFGAALTTVIGMRQLGFNNSTLTLSEDHAYESHNGGEGDHQEDSIVRHTCEVAIPGNNKAQKAKRGQETATTFHTNKRSRLTPATSWLYMGNNPVYCRTTPMILAAALGNLNCLIDSKGNSMELNSEPLMLVKRELLWVLRDKGHLDMFPFALCELGWSEEHLTSTRGDIRISIPALAPIPVTTIESLYHEAITCCKEHYDDKQVYPYCYLGFFHKDGGQEEEERFGLALKYFGEAARVASGYLYEWGDSLQLTKVMTKLSEFTVREILNASDVPRVWIQEVSAIECARWLFSFYDCLLLWEERSGEQSFLPICESNHKTGISKAFSLLSHEVRGNAFESYVARSKRLQGPLVAALLGGKFSISDMHLNIVAETGRRRKRKER